MEGWIWTRIACLGKETVTHLGWERLIRNHQFARADYLIDCFLDGRHKINIDQLDPRIFACRPDVQGLQEQLANLEFEREGPLAIVLDSYAELTEQRFVHKDHGWSFCCRYSELDPQRIADFRALGRIPEEMLPTAIMGEIGVLRHVWPDTPIFYLHFPSTLENRPEFVRRAEIISATLREVQKHVVGVFSIEANPDFALPDPNPPPELTGFPYHFHPNVALDLAAGIVDAIEGRLPMRSETGGKRVASAGTSVGVRKLGREWL